MSNVYTPAAGSASAPGTDTNLRDQATDMARDLKNKASNVADNLTNVAKEQVASLGSAAKGLSEQATSKIEDAVNRQKSVGANYIGSVARAVDRAAGEFEQEIPQAASYMRQASNQLQGFADTIDGRDLRELAGEVREFARQQPTIFFGGAVILGFAALRFFKSAGGGSASSMPDSRGPGMDSRAAGMDYGRTYPRAD